MVHHTLNGERTADNLTHAMLYLHSHGLRLVLVWIQTRRDDGKVAGVAPCHGILGAHCCTQANCNLLGQQVAATLTPRVAEQVEIGKADEENGAVEAATNGSGEFAAKGVFKQLGIGQIGALIVVGEVVNPGFSLTQR